MRPMKILSLFLLLASTQVFAGLDWQYSIQHPDGRIETKNVKDSEGFFFHVGEHLCSVSEPEEHDQEMEDYYYDVKCLSGDKGIHTSMSTPQGSMDHISLIEIIQNPKGKPYKIEIVAFNQSSKKTKKPFAREDAKISLTQMKSR